MTKNIPKYWNYSILIGIIGWCYLIILNYANLDKTSDLIMQLPMPGKYDSFWYRLIAFGFGIIGIYYGKKMVSKNIVLNAIGILISLGLIIMTSLPYIMPFLYNIYYNI